MKEGASPPTPALRVAGVPEHLNLPWYRAIESGAMPGVIWLDQPGGTGQTMALFEAGELDAAVVLTEGAVAGRARGVPIVPVSLYLASPLRWGIHVAAESPIQGEDDLTTARFAISRPGSGSQLMAHVLADRLGFRISNDRFVTVGDLAGARSALADGSADAFLWDRFMTSRIVRGGEWRLVGEQPTPWPAFVVVARDDLDEASTDRLWEALHRVWQEAQDLMTDPDAVAMIASRFELEPEDAQTWFASARWVEPEAIDETELDAVADTLARVGAH